VLTLDVANRYETLSGLLAERLGAGGRSAFAADPVIVPSSAVRRQLTLTLAQRQVQAARRRAGLGFVFIGCRFDLSLPRAVARQIIKRSQGPHSAILTDEAARMETRFLAEQGIPRIAMHLADVSAALAGAPHTAAVPRCGYG
jgi:hypothetical protein